MSEENINFLKEQSKKIRIEEIMRCIRILQECEEQSKWSKQGRIYLELAIIKMCKIEYDTSKEVFLSRLNKLEKIIKEGNITIDTNISNIKNQFAENKSVKKVSSLNEQRLNLKEEILEVNSNSKITIEDVKKSWKDILEVFKAKRHMVLYASLITGNVDRKSVV